MLGNDCFSKYLLGFFCYYPCQKLYFLFFCDVTIPCDGLVISPRALCLASDYFFLRYKCKRSVIALSWTVKKNNWHIPTAAPVTVWVLTEVGDFATCFKWPGSSGKVSGRKMEGLLEDVHFSALFRCSPRPAALRHEFPTSGPHAASYHEAVSWLRRCSAAVQVQLVAPALLLPRHSTNLSKYGTSVSFERMYEFSQLDCKSESLSELLFISKGNKFHLDNAGFLAWF